MILCGHRARRKLGDVHALKMLHISGVVLNVRARWSCVHPQPPMRPQINRHGRPPEGGSTIAGRAE